MLFFFVFLVQIILGVSELQVNEESPSNGNSTAPIISEDEFDHVTLSAIVIASIPSFVGFGVAFYLVRKAVIEMQSKKTAAAEKSNHSETFEIELSDEVTNSKTVGTAPPTKDSLYMKTFYAWTSANTYTSLSTDSTSQLEAMPCFPFEMTMKNRQPGTVYKYADIIKDEDEFAVLGPHHHQLHPAPSDLQDIEIQDITYTLKL